jgi:hypothetical protein
MLVTIKINLTTRMKITTDWKMRAIFDRLNDMYAKCYHPPKHLAIDRIIVLFKDRIIFKQYIPKKHKQFGVKIYKPCASE